MDEKEKKNFENRSFIVSLSVSIETGCIMNRD